MRPAIRYLLIAVAILLAIRIFQELMLLPAPQKVIIQPTFAEPKISNLTIDVVDKTGKIAIFDEAHENSHSISSDFSQFASIFSEAKFEVRAVDKNFTQEIKNAHVLVLPAPKKRYTNEEVSEINKLVKSGMTLIVLAEPDSIKAVNEIVLNHGISFNDDLVFDTEKYTITSNYPLIGKFDLSAPITKGLTEIALMQGCSLSISSSKPLAFSDKTTKSNLGYGNFTLMAASESNKVFAICDADLLSNKFLKFFDHEILARNLVNWS